MSDLEISSGNIDTVLTRLSESRHRKMELPAAITLNFK